MGLTACSRLLGLMLMLCCAAGLYCGGRSKPASPEPEAINSRVKMSIAAIPVGNPEDIFAVRVTLENFDREDYLLNLGSIHGNGKCQHPDALKLILADPKGRSRKLLFTRSPGHTDPIGRTIPYLVPLRASSSYVLNLNLRQYSPLDADGSGLRLVEGKYRLRAELDGMGPWPSGTEVANLWRGKLRSNEISFRIR